MEIIPINTERALSPTNIELADFVINPYKGCSIGCTYCYSRSNKGIRKINKEWGRFVYVKQNLPGLLEKELYQFKKREIRQILIGSTTEAFQPVEEKYKITCRVMEILKKYDIPVTVLTKMNLISRHLHLFDYSDKNTIYFTFNSEIVMRYFENHGYNLGCDHGSSRKEKLDTIESISKSRINLIVYISPVFPHLTDAKEIFESLDGKAGKIFFEGYNTRLGNWYDVRKKLDESLLSKYERIFFNKDEYENYWKNFITETEALNEKFGFKLKFFIYPFDSYYSETS
jgi:DNA repair photolyase